GIYQDETILLKIFIKVIWNILHIRLIRWLILSTQNNYKIIVLLTLSGKKEKIIPIFKFLKLAGYRMHFLYLPYIIKCLCRTIKNQTCTCISGYILNFNQPEGKAGFVFSFIRDYDQMSLYRI